MHKLQYKKSPYSEKELKNISMKKILELHGISIERKGSPGRFGAIPLYYYYNGKHVRIMHDIDSTRIVCIKEFGIDIGIGPLPENI